MTNELDQLQGKWNVKALEMDGQNMPATMLTAARIVVQGTQFQSLGMGATFEGTLTVDPSASPKRFDLTFTAGPEKGKTNFGIYELDGDRWRICLNISGGPAPTTFATAPGTGHALEVLSRASA
jgi:uncharacterized protein (TIGR03067 family)